MCDILQKINF